MMIMTSCGPPTVTTIQAKFKFWHPGAAAGPGPGAASPRPGPRSESDTVSPGRLGEPDTAR